jgi:hypothetical protein
VGRGRGNGKTREEQGREDEREKGLNMAIERVGLFWFGRRSFVRLSN